MEESRQKERMHGSVHKVTGSLIVADNMRGVRMNQIVEIGTNKMAGEIMRIEGNLAYIQCFQYPVGLSVGDLVLGTSELLNVELGPGLLGNFFDGVQRPLIEISKLSGSLYLPNCMYQQRLNNKLLWQFNPKNFKQGDALNQGDIFGTVPINPLFQCSSILVPPQCKGKITFIAPPGNYDIHQEVLELEFNGIQKKYSMSHKWPVRKPRPVEEKLSVSVPFLTGLRVIDGLFSLAKGGTCAIPGASGCGKGGVIDSLIKSTSRHANIYVGCGQRGNEIAGLLDDFSNITVRKEGKDYSLMENSCVVANTSNMPVAVREASIYTGITIAEYFRDMGKDVVVIADSLSRWGESLKEISLNMSQFPAPYGNPTYLKSRICQFYERAGNARCLGKPNRTGSISLIGTVSPSMGDFSDPLTSCVLEAAQVFWALDKRVAQIRHFPSINWEVSTSNYYNQLDNFFKEEHDKQFPLLRKKIRDVLREEQELHDVVKQLGKDHLSDIQQLVMQTAKMIKQQFLQQNVFAPFDYYCPLQKTIGMMKSLVFFYDSAKKAIQKAKQTKMGKKSKNGAVFLKIKELAQSVLSRMRTMKFQDPKANQNQIRQFFQQIVLHTQVIFNQIQISE